jgi:deoxyribodipyrimidine photo-lyase
MLPSYPAGLMWFRRDLRAHDNAALYRALRACGQVYCAFVFDTAILQRLPRRDRRVEFIVDSVHELHSELRALAGDDRAGLVVRHGMAAEELLRLARELGVSAVFTNHDYEPGAIARDMKVRQALAADGIALHTFKDQAIFERDELLTQGGRPYSVFTPYKNAWLAKVDPFYLKAYPVERHARALAPLPEALRADLPGLSTLGFESTNLHELGFHGGGRAGARCLAAFLERIDAYDRTRDFPAADGTSRLSVHLRFGTVSIRRLAAEALARAGYGSSGASTWLSELVWRDFYFQVLSNFPHVADETGWGGNFRREYDAIEWEHGAQADALFEAWTEGRTGYPFVDAAMAQILDTGFMHNRLRMVTASFLCKDLGIDWRIGERWFAEKLNDYDLSANNGGWQWASSSGCDAQPYFRIFNPVTQSEKFDPAGDFIRRWLPQLEGLRGKAIHAPWLASPVELAAAGLVLGRDYPHPVVQHDEARQRTLARYAVVKTAR